MLLLPLVTNAVRSASCTLCQLCQRLCSSAYGALQICFMIMIMITDTVLGHVTQASVCLSMGPSIYFKYRPICSLMVPLLLRFVLEAESSNQSINADYGDVVNVETGRRISVWRTFVFAKWK